MGLQASEIEGCRRQARELQEKRRYLQMDTHARARIKREVEYLSNRLAREETERDHAKERENEHKFLQLSRNVTLIKVRFPCAV